MFHWLREKVKNAVLAGVADAVEYLDRQGAADADEAPRLLEERVRLLAAPEGDRPAEGRPGGRKGKAG